MQSYRQLVNYLKKNLPEIELSVHRAKIADGDYAKCNPPVKNKFTIQIRSGLDEVACILLLMHEVAHALSWHTDKHPSDHGPEFWKAHRRVWDLYQKWIHEE